MPLASQNPYPSLVPRLVVRSTYFSYGYTVGSRFSDITSSKISHLQRLISRSQVRSFVASLACLFVDSLLHSLFCSFIRWFARSSVRSFVGSLARLFVHSLVHSLVCSFIHWFTRFSVRSFVGLLACLFVDSLVHSPVCLFIS